MNPIRYGNVKRPPLRRAVASRPCLVCRHLPSASLLTRLLLLVALISHVGLAQVAAPPRDTKSAYLSDKGLAYERLITLGRALGDRLFEPGKERSDISGTLTLKGVVRTIRLVRDLSGAYKLTETDGRIVASFDGEKNTTPSADRKPEDEQLEESLTQDAPEVLLFALMNRQPYRFIGGRFRLDDGTTEDYKGPWLDIYQLSAVPDNRQDKESRPKFFMFDSVDYLLRRVVYDVPSGTDRTTRVEVLIDGWRAFAGQKVPGSITRRENGSDVWSFEIKEAAIGPRVANEKF